MVALFFLIVRNFASRSLQLFDIGDWTKKYLSIMDIYDKAIQELLEKYRSISSVKKESIERAIHCLLEQKEIAKSLSDSGISFCYQFVSCICLGNFNLTNLLSFRNGSSAIAHTITSCTTRFGGAKTIDSFSFLPESSSCGRKLLRN